MRSVRWSEQPGDLCRRAIPLRLRRRLLDLVLEALDGHGASSTLSFSSVGQDMILRHVLGPGANSGFYVDVGAWKPKLGSNTYALYRSGWRGFTIEPRRGSAREFRKDRPRDEHFELGIAPAAGTFPYMVAGGSNSSVNSFKADYMASIGAEIVDEYPVKVDRLDNFLARSLPSGRTIDLLAIDTEGSDLGVLQSNDWARFRPTMVLIEDSLGDAGDFLRGKEYIQEAVVPILGEIRDHLFVDPAILRYRDI